MNRLNGFFLFWILRWLLNSPEGRLLLLVAVLWYLDNRYLGLLAALWAPVVRSQRVAALRRTVEVNPADVRTMVELADVYMRDGKARAAGAVLEQAMARGEDSARAQYLYGAALVRTGRHADGRVRLEAALAKSPDVAFGNPYLYLLEAAFATEGAQSARVEQLVASLELYESVEVFTRAGRICAAAGRKDLARRLYQDAIKNYGYIPPKMRRRHRHWLARARLGLLLV